MMCGSNVGNCRHRYWQYSMLAPDRSPSLIKERNDYLTYIQIIKAHGSSKARAIQNAIRQAKTCVETDLCGTMAKALASQEEAGSEE